MSLPAVDNPISAIAPQLLDACPLCAGRTFEALPTPERWVGPETFGGLRGRFGLSRCRGCRLVFVNPRPSRQQLRAFYDAGSVAAGPSVMGAYTDFLSGLLPRRLTASGAAYLLDRIERALPPGAPRTLLECGTGKGTFLLRARARGWQVWGLEPGRRGRQICRSVGLNVTDRLDELPAGAFGLIVLNRVLGQLTDPIGALQGIQRLVAPEGRLFVNVPNTASLRARLALPALSRYVSRVDERYRAFPIELTYYDSHTLAPLLAKGGWTVEQTFTVGLGLDEFIVQSDLPALPHRTEGAVTKRRGGPQRRPQRRLRHLLRDAFLDLELGENLAVIARPSRA